MFKSKKSIIFWSIVNALFMTVFTFLWINNSDIITDDEEFLIKNTTGIKNTLFKMRKKPASDELLFVDLAWEKQLKEEKDEAGMHIGKRAITNRTRIAELLSYLNKKNEHKFIILDVFFKDSADFKSDSLLQVELSKTKNILIPYHVGINGENELPIFNTPIALSDYGKDEVENNFIKFKCLYEDSIRTTPLVMYETLHGNKYTDKGLFGTSQDRLALNSFILDLRIWRQNLVRDIEVSSLSDTSGGPKYQIMYMSDLLGDAINPAINKDLALLPEEERPGVEDYKMISEGLVPELTKNKIIVIGDFSDTDIHETIYGATPGPLILLNIYLALREGDNLFSVWFILFLIAGFYVISYNCFSGNDFLVSFLNKATRKIKQFSRASIFLNLIGYILYFIVLSVLSFFLFNIHITILLLAVYMEVLDNILSYFKKKQNQAVAGNVDNADPTQVLKS
jgi:hypothetical protein